MLRLTKAEGQRGPWGPGGPAAKVQWLPNAGGSGLIPGQGTGPHMLHLRAQMSQL